MSDKESLQKKAECGSENNNFKLIFTSLPIVMFILNEDNVITEMNPAALQFVGKTFDEVQGRRFGEVFQCFGSFDDKRGCGFGRMCSICEFRKAAIKAIETGFITDIMEFRKILVQGDKTIEKWFRSSFTPVFINGRRHIVVSLVDITDCKHKELSIMKQNQALAEANRMKSEFLANMSHEIRTPLNGIVGMIDLTLLTELDSEQKENLLTAKSCVSALLHIINEILDFSKLDANKIVIETINFDIKHLVKEMIKAQGSIANQKGIELNYSFAENLPEILAGDPNRIRQVLNNLISNAVKFTEKGKVHISLKINQMTDEFVELRFMVSDTGMGISKEDYGKLFQSFSQVDSSITRKFGGTGLGLAISKRLVEMMGGTIWVESEKGKGSNFYFTAKFHKTDRIYENQTETVQIKKINRTAKPLKILLVEDDMVSRQVISRMLKEKGHMVDMASNGIQAIQLYGTEKYDIILMDIYMPEMDGIETTKKIREAEGDHKHTPIIALTAHALHGDRERFLKLGMDEYLAKPIQMNELFYLLERVFAEKKEPVHFNGMARLGNNGELIFTNESKTRTEEEMIPVIQDISKHLSILQNRIGEKDLSAIEAAAHKIKEFAALGDAEELKLAAFKIELAARRGNMDEAMKYTKQIECDLETYRKSFHS